MTEDELLPLGLKGGPSKGIQTLLGRVPVELTGLQRSFRSSAPARLAGNASPGVWGKAPHWEGSAAAWERAGWGLQAAVPWGSHSSGEQMLLLHGVSPAPLSDEASVSADKGLTFNEGQIHCPEQPNGNWSWKPKNQLLTQWSNTGQVGPSEDKCGEASEHSWPHLQGSLSPILATAAQNDPKRWDPRLLCYHPVTFIKLLRTEH